MENQEGCRRPLRILHIFCWKTFRPETRRNPPRTPPHDKPILCVVWLPFTFLLVLHLRAAFDLPLIRMHAQRGERERHLTAGGDGTIADESNPFSARDPFVVDYATPNLFYKGHTVRSI